MTNRMKWEYTTNKEIATLLNPNNKILSATIMHTENSIRAGENFYLHMKRGDGKEINEYFKSMASAQSYVRFFYK